MLVLALCGHALTASAMERSQVHQVHFAWCVILPTCLFSFQGLSLPVPPAGAHTHTPSFCHSCQGHHPLLVSGIERALSHTILAADPSGFSGISKSQIRSSYQPEVLQMKPRAGIQLDCKMPQGKCNSCLICYYSFSIWDSV